MLWGVVAAAGVYTVPVFIYGIVPLFGLSVWMVIAKRRKEKATSASVYGPLIGMNVCLALTAVAYAPILATQGLDTTLLAVHNAAGIAQEQFGTFAIMFDETAALWSRHAHPAFIVALMLGAGSFVVLAVRRRTIAHVAPLVLLIGSFVLVWLSASIMPPRAWLFVLPTAMLCASRGLVAIVDIIKPVKIRRALASIVIGCLLVGSVLSGWSVVGQDFLCAEQNTIVDVPVVLDECQEFGVDRCSLLMRYTPATGYYLTQRKISHPLKPDHADSKRVYIVADAVKPLDSLWDKNKPEYARYETPRRVRELARSTLYVADRVSEDGQAAQATTIKPLPGDG